MSVSQCGISLVPGPHATATKPDRSEPAVCYFEIQPYPQTRPVREEIELYRIQVRVYTGDLNSRNVRRKLPFVRQGSAWIAKSWIPGSSDKDLREPGKEIQAEGWKGVRGMSDARCYMKDQSGLCDIYVAAISNGMKSVVLVGGPQSENTFNDVLGSIRFEKKRQP